MACRVDLDGEYWAVPQGGRQPKATDRLDTHMLEVLVQKPPKSRPRNTARPPTAEELAARRRMRRERKAVEAKRRAIVQSRLRERETLKREGIEIFDGIFVGGRVSAMNHEVLSNRGIYDIVNATRSVRCYFGDLPRFRYFQIPVEDHPEEDVLSHFEAAASFLHAARQRGRPVLVHCVQGQSRSPTIILAYAIRYLGMSLNNAITKLESVHCYLSINNGFKRQLMEYELQIQGSVSLDFFLKRTINTVDFFAPAPWQNTSSTPNQVKPRKRERALADRRPLQKLSENNGHQPCRRKKPRIDEWVAVSGSAWRKPEQVHSEYKPWLVGWEEDEDKLKLKEAQGQLDGTYWSPKPTDRLARRRRRFMLTSTGSSSEDSKENGSSHKQSHIEEDEEANSGCDSDSGDVGDCNSSAEAGDDSESDRDGDERTTNCGSGLDVGEDLAIHRMQILKLYESPTESCDHGELWEGRSLKAKIPQTPPTRGKKAIMQQVAVALEQPSPSSSSDAGSTASPSSCCVALFGTDTHNTSNDLSASSSCESSPVRNVYRKRRRRRSSNVSQFSDLDGEYWHVTVGRRRHR